MHTLVLNAAEGLLQFVISRKEEDGLPVVLAAQVWNAPSQGAELLAPALEKAFALLDITAKDIARIACVAGPGSFTGIRLTLATATGLALATGALMAGIPYLPLLAAGAGEVLASLEVPADLWTATHARNNLVHMQGFAPGRQPLSEILVLSPQEAALTIKGLSRERPACIFGTGLTRNRQAWEALLTHLPQGSRFLPASFNTPTAQALALAADSLEYTDADIKPLYARPSDAEENLARIAANLGLNPQEAEARLADLTSSLHFQE